MVQASGPVDGDVMAMVKLYSAADGATGVRLTEGVKAIKDRAILANVEALEGADLVLLRLRRDGAQEGDVVVGMEAAKVALASRVGLVDLKVL